MSSDKKNNQFSKLWNDLLANINLGKNIIKIDTLLGPSTKIKGDFYMTGNVKVDGKINGEIKINGDLIIGESAEIKGDITAENIIVYGTVNGDITAKGHLVVKSSATVNGDHSAKNITIEDGSTFIGDCKILGARTAYTAPESYQSIPDIELPEIPELVPPSSEE